MAATCFEGQLGDDTIGARDGALDVVRRAGLGNDSAVVDDKDGVESVERVDAAALKALPATVTAGKVKLKRSRGRLLARIPVRCPARRPVAVLRR